MITVAVTDDGKSVSLKALRLFRVFRPLRLIVKSPNLKVVLDTIIKSFNVLFHVLLFILLIVFLYAITGMELFGGKKVVIFYFQFLVQEKTFTWSG